MILQLQDNTAIDDGYAMHIEDTEIGFNNTFSIDGTEFNRVLDTVVADIANFTVTTTTNEDDTIYYNIDVHYT